MQCVCRCITDENHVSKVYSVATILQLQFMVHVTLHFSCPMFLYINISAFRSIAQCPIWLLSVVSLFRAFAVCCLGTFLNDIEMILVAVVIIIGITFDFTFHMRCISVVNSL